MPYYTKLGNLPNKRHIQFRRPDGYLYSEEVFGTEGFVGPTSTLYHIHPPTQVMGWKAMYSTNPLKSSLLAEGLKILVTGDITAKQGKLSEVQALSLEHVKRSRLEPGCISHEVLQDMENAQRALMELAEGSPKMTVFEANQLKVKPP